MNEFLNALKADLLDRRLRAILLLVTAGLIAALAYAVLGGASSSPSESAPGLSPLPRSGAGSISPVAAGQNPNQALSETPNGAAKQRGGATRDPFNPLPGAVTTPTPTASSKGGGSSSKTSTPSSGGSAPSAPSTTPSKPTTTYSVSVQMGQVAPGTPAQSAQLTAYNNLQINQKLPSSALRLLAFEGVSSDGKKALFKIVGEVIPRAGLAVCRPSPAQCQTLELQAGQSQEFEYLPPSGPAVVYELQVASITSEKH
jgi:hypothetical protein